MDTIDCQVEEMVARWYSITRNMDFFEKKSVIPSILVTIQGSLVKQGCAPEVAERIAKSTLTKWADEVDGLSFDNFHVFEVLETKIKQILK